MVFAIKEEQIEKAQEKYNEENGITDDETGSTESSDSSSAESSAS